MKDKAFEHKGHGIVKKRTNAQPPEELKDLKISKPKNSAAGFPALFSSVNHMNKYMSKSDAVKTMFKLNQKGGFDCPGCAWPDPDDERSKLGEYCENGIKAIAEEASKKTIGKDFFAKHSISEMLEWDDFTLGKKGRLSEPMILGEGEEHYKPISWKDAFIKIGEQLNNLVDPNEAIFYTSGRTSNEAAFLYQLFVRALGTNNLPDCSNMCHESSGQGLSQTVGIGKGSVSLVDLYKAEVIIVMGQNPGTNHPRMLSALQKCKENGGKIISVNPIKESGLLSFKHPQKVSQLIGNGTKLTDIYAQVQINGDVALLKAIILSLLEEEKTNPGKVIDKEFIEQHTEGYESFLHSLQNEKIEDCLSDSGISKEQLDEIVDCLKFKKKIIICWAMGLTQHENAVDNIKEVVNLLLLKGAIGKEGAGTCPVRGHSNVQGDRTMGIWEAPKESFLSSLDKEFGINSPREHGYSVVDAIAAMHEKKAKVFFAMGGNFISATPDTEITAEALRNCELTVQVSTKLNRSHLIHGKEAIILPCLGRTEIDLQNGKEQFVTVENSMGIVHSSKGVLEPSSKHLRSEVSIICHLANASLKDEQIPWSSFETEYDLIRDRIESVIPGFENYNERVRKPEGFYLPNGARKGVFNTDSSKAKFTINHRPNLTKGDSQFRMMTVRSHDQYNTTIYGLDDRYRGIYNERRVVLMNIDDMNARNLSARQRVDLSSHYKEEIRWARNFQLVPYDIPRGCLASYFPEANVLVPLKQIARGSKTPASKSIIVEVHPI